MATPHAPLLDALREGSIDAAARILEGLHDARVKRDAAPTADARREALGDLVYALAQAQAQALQQVLGVGAAAAPALRSSLREALGLPRAAHALRFRLPAVARQRLLARNASATASALAVELGAFVSDAGHLLDHAVTLRLAERPVSPLEASVERLRFATDAGAVAPGATALIELSLDADALTAQATVGVVYRAALTLSLGGASPRAVDLELVVDGR